MKNLYFFLVTTLVFALTTEAQTTVNYPQRVANYDAFFSDSGGNFDNSTDEFGMWANGGGAKQSVAWRSFTDTGLPGGNAVTMAVGDSFTITVSATQTLFGQIGVALLASPSTATWADRVSNYAVQVNQNGNSGTANPWEVVSTGGTIDASSISGSTSYADFKFKFTLTSATTMNVSINDGAETFDVTINNQNITGFSVYFADDWNGSANANIYWKPTSEYTTPPLSTDEFGLKSTVKVIQNKKDQSFSINKDLTSLKLYDLSGKEIETFTGNYLAGKEFNIANLSQGLYILKIIDVSGAIATAKLLKQ